jgi:FKBP-type peptidyl-prolyl cis-trans isomerase
MTRSTGRRSRVLWLALAGAASVCGAARAEQPARGPEPVRLEISFKLDPRLVSGVYGGGERWVSPPTYVGATAQDTVEARVEGFRADGAPIRIQPRWIASDPEMVTVSPEEAEQVRILIKRAGESSVEILAGKISTRLIVKAKGGAGKTMQIEIARAAPAPATPARTTTSEGPASSSASPRESREQIAARNKREGEEFLAHNRTREGVVTLPSGLQYEVVRPAEGRTPTVSDMVICHYRGTFVDGRELTNSYAARRPVSLSMRRLALPGWTEALTRMPVGSKWRIYLPPELAYGEKGHRRGKRMEAVGPNVTLIFELELLSIKGTPGSKGGIVAVADPPSPDGEDPATGIPR